MKNVLAGCALAISVFPAMAADMPFKTPSPPPAPFFTWTGCYLGGSLGGIWRSTNNVGIGLADGGSEAAALAAAASLPTAFDVGRSGWIVSGQTGCNYQAASWVFGIETDISNGLDASPLLLPIVGSYRRRIGASSVTQRNRAPAYHRRAGLPPPTPPEDGLPPG